MVAELVGHAGLSVDRFSRRIGFRYGGEQQMVLSQKGSLGEERIETEGGETLGGETPPLRGDRTGTIFLRKSRRFLFGSTVLFQANKQVTGIMCKGSLTARRWKRCRFPSGLSHQSLMEF
jgi:hypothetical protein